MGLYKKSMGSNEQRKSEIIDNNTRDLDHFMDKKKMMDNNDVLKLLEKARQEGRELGLAESKHNLDKRNSEATTDSKKSLKRKGSEWIEMDESEEEEQVLGPFGEIRKVNRRKDNNRNYRRYRDSDDSSDEEAYYSRKSKLNKYADKYFSERTKRKVSWPNHFVRRRGEKVEFTDLTLPEFACGAIRIVEATLPKTKEIRFAWDLLSYIGNLLEASRTDGLEIMKTAHKQILGEIQNRILNNKDWTCWDSRKINDV